ncbi:hypothetical protein P7228_11385 [Altererythrobacter arenosus]|uniref:Lipoprotein n=1 Tax=Altererythrobacter arenosus TaxID=3032592 RepID=A0ABY8FU05_9SPHN|nr:hypothetical protein [Altererythrobacter sp. CAU 1644]WFL76596.1 hypothetical protein P7228_11385 [Altererythrobacter sp. CAU 1644]
MKPIYLNFAGALALTFVIAACVPAAPEPTPAPSPSPTPAPTPIATAAPVVQRSLENWLDAPQTPGDWRYSSGSRISQASFGIGANASSFTMTCIAANRAVRLERAHQSPANIAMRIRTETGERLINAQPLAGAREGVVFAQLASGDPLLDAMAVTKGRFAVEVEGMPTLYLPSWTEVSRVIEDCRQ